ncbi:MAG: serine/threonine-protein kinase [Armatimonadota bacterium]|nr:serine/threonine-protein kinase [Armatimonadota bacterium]
MELAGGQIVGEYRLVSMVGRGAKGEVWKAEGINGNGTGHVAIKFLNHYLLHDTQEAGRFRREAKALLRLDNPNIAKVHGCGVHNDHLPYIVMQFVDETLKDYIRRKGRLDPAEALQLAGNIADGLDACHRRGIIHRDVKSQNIGLLDGRKRAVLLDFGIAKMEDLTLSMSGQVIGTPHYMSPEQADGQPLDGRSDQYSLAVVLWEMLCGQTLFDGPTPMAICYKHVYEPPPPLNVPGSDTMAPSFRLLDSALKQALSKNPKDRFRTCREFVTAAGGQPSSEVADALDAPPKPEPKPAAPHRPDAQLMKSLVIVGACFGALIVLLLVMLALIPPPPPPIERPVDPAKSAFDSGDYIKALNLYSSSWDANHWASDALGAAKCNQSLADLAGDPRDKIEKLDDSLTWCDRAQQNAMGAEVEEARQLKSALLSKLGHTFADIGERLRALQTFGRLRSNGGAAFDDCKAAGDCAAQLAAETKGAERRSYARSAVTWYDRALRGKSGQDEATLAAVMAARAEMRDILAANAVAHRPRSRRRHHVHRTSTRPPVTPRTQPVVTQPSGPSLPPTTEPQMPKAE